MDLDHEREDHTDYSRHSPSRRGDLSNLILRAYERLIKNRALLLFLLFLAVYNLTLQTSFTRDCMTNLYLPLSMIEHGSISLEFFPELCAAGRPYFLVPCNGSLHSIFGIGAPLFAVPFYLPLLLCKSPPSFLTLIYLSKFVASFYTALSAVLLFCAMRRLTREKWALVISLVYGFATPVFCTSSQALWQHAPSLFLISLTIYLLVRGEDRPLLLALAGLPLGLSVLVRTTNMVFILPILLYFIWKKRSRLLPFLLCLLPGAAITALYNYSAYGAFYRFPLMAPKYLLPASEFAAYNEFGGYWQTPFLTGFGGNLISPSRGLFVTSPILLVALAGIFLLVWKRKVIWERLFPLGCCFALAFLAQLLLISKKTAWTGGLSFGNRLLLDALPFLVFLFIPALEYYEQLREPSWRKLARIVFILLLCLSLLIQVEGIVSYDRGSWNLQGTAEELAWSIENNQLFFYARNPEPVTPPCIKQLSGEPARLSSCRVDIIDGFPCLHFHLSESAILKWYIIVPGNDAKIFLFEIRGMKGPNDIFITGDDIDFIENFEDLESLKNLVQSSPSYEVEVIDPLTGVSKTCYFEASP